MLLLKVRNLLISGSILVESPSMPAAKGNVTFADFAQTVNAHYPKFNMLHPVSLFSWTDYRMRTPVLPQGYLSAPIKRVAL